MRLWRRHRHEWDATAVNHITEGAYFPRLDRQVTVGHKTQVLRVCVSCGRRDVEELDGKWSLEQVRGLMAEPIEHRA